MGICLPPTVIRRHQRVSIKGMTVKSKQWNPWAVENGQKHGGMVYQILQYLSHMEKLEFRMNRTPIKFYGICRWRALLSNLFIRVLQSVKMSTRPFSTSEQNHRSPSIQSWEATEVPSMLMAVLFFIHRIQIPQIPWTEPYSDPAAADHDVKCPCSTN